MSIYNDIHSNPAREQIVVDCQPDQYSRDTVCLDKEDFEEIQEQAKKLGWIK